jgi:hypothetical protein
MVRVSASATVSAQKKMCTHPDCVLSHTGQLPLFGCELALDSDEGSDDQGLGIAVNMNESCFSKRF